MPPHFQQQLVEAAITVDGSGRPNGASPALKEAVATHERKKERELDNDIRFLAIAMLATVGATSEAYAHGGVSIDRASAS